YRPPPAPGPARYSAARAAPALPVRPGAGRVGRYQPVAQNHQHRPQNVSVPEGQNVFYVPYSAVRQPPSNAPYTASAGATPVTYHRYVAGYAAGAPAGESPCSLRPVAPAPGA